MSIDFIHKLAKRKKDFKRLKHKSSKWYLIYHKNKDECNHVFMDGYYKDKYKQCYWCDKMIPVNDYIDLQQIKIENKEIKQKKDLLFWDEDKYMKWYYQKPLRNWKYWRKNQYKLF